MSGKRMKRFGMLAALGLVLAGCGGASDEALVKYTKAKGLSELQTQAFMACASATRSNKPVLPGVEPNTQLKMTKVPFDVCLCQSSAIMAVFTPKQYKSYSTFAEYLAMADKTKRKPPRFGKKLLQDGIKAGDVSPRLAKNFSACVATWTKANAEEAKTVFETLEAPPPAADKAKKTASAS